MLIAAFLRYFPNSMASKKFEDLDLTSEEIKRLENALKDEKFRKMFVEYAEEISDPENRKRYEEEIKMMEEERGMNVEFIKPEPGHVLKTSVNDTTKAFINICQSDKIGTPSSKPQVGPDGRRGINWSIPHSHVKPREEKDKQGNTCKVFDVAFHPDTYRMAENVRFRKLVEDTALDGIENQLGFKVDKKNIKRMKNMRYKGTPVPSVIRSRKPEGAKKMDPNDILNDMPYPYQDKDSAERAEEMRDSVKQRKDIENKKCEKTKSMQAKEINNEFIEPKYTVIHRSELDLQEYRNAPDARPSTKPKELEIKIYLPLLNSAADVECDVFEQKLSLQSSEPAKYKLDLRLPYPVDEDEAKAKFDRSKKCLSVTVPVLPGEIPEVSSLKPEINGVDAEKLQENDLQSPDTDVIKEISPSEPLIQEITPNQPLIQEIPPNQPLIPEIPPNEPLIQDINSNSEHTVETQNEEPESFLEGCNLFEPPVPDLLYSLPEFTYNQDLDTVSFIINVKNVTTDNITKSFPSKNCLELKLTSIGSGGFPLHYSLVVKFPEGHNIVAEHCSLDVSNMNVVVLLLKDRDSRGTWNGFLAGFDDQELKEYLFVTEANLQRELDQLEAFAVLNRQEQTTPSPDTPTVQVTDMSHRKLQIDIKKCVTEDDDELDELPSSADIEVVHEKGLPSLHSILKQRSMSESSDDYSSSCNSSCSPSSPRDDLFGQRKSVSFSERIDKATFKSSAAVTSMTTALKSKRRRNRKREEKKNGRKRCNSGGSSSGEDLDHKSVGESVLGEEEESEGTTEEDRSPVEGCSDVKQEEADAKSAIVQSIKDNIASAGEKYLCEDSDDDGDDDRDNMRTSTESESKADDVKGETDDDNHERTNTMDGKVCAGLGVSVNSEVKGKSDECDSKAADNEGEQGDKVFKRDSGNADIQVSAKEVISNSGIQELMKDQNTSVIKVKSDGSGDDSGVECSVDGSSDDKSGAVETMLSWQDKPDAASQDHRTQCAFSFSNAVIYDLDVD